mmetsp:Transcript_21028/g.67001  ORF Transcript_21028/g.67001 Transcript_21028/m.67001 type:complete len:91 (-) Transcript_21028:177-449(-)
MCICRSTMEGEKTRTSMPVQFTLARRDLALSNYELDEEEQEDPSDQCHWSVSIFLPAALVCQAIASGYFVAHSWRSSGLKRFRRFVRREC